MKIQKPMFRSPLPIKGCPFTPKQQWADSCTERGATLQATCWHRGPPRGCTQGACQQRGCGTVSGCWPQAMAALISCAQPILWQRRHEPWKLRQVLLLWTGHRRPDCHRRNENLSLCGKRGHLSHECRSFGGNASARAVEVEPAEPEEELPLDALSVCDN